MKQTTFASAAWEQKGKVTHRMLTTMLTDSQHQASRLSPVCVLPDV
jgi:hypothetical protein